VRLAGALLVMMAMLAGAPAAQQTFTGMLSDSSCKGHHEAGGEAGLPDKPDDCVLACVRGGSKFVLVTDDKKVFVLAKQDDPQLQKLAAAQVTVTGTLAGEVLTVSKIEAAK
jgi:hypothetical protein